ncbi:MAG: hypothetical protein DLM58_15320 [Pseudonocardiales bacterium]|nr:MAG: hypothetical protein DLM58_15320 [Pseudonocardiales bacterium]
MLADVSFDVLPDGAAWLHREARSGFEVVHFPLSEDGYLIDGRAAAIEDAQTWVVDYEIAVSRGWETRRAAVTSRTTSGVRSTLLQTDGDGQWSVDGTPAPQLDGCLDVDLEASAFTNALPVHRLQLAVGERADAPAAYVRARDATVDRLEQCYARITDDGLHQRFDYSAPAFDFACMLTYDRAGLLLDYPGIAVRAG